MEDEKQVKEQTNQINKQLGFGKNANQSFGDYQKWLAEMKGQVEVSEDQMLSDRRTKSFVTRGFGSDTVLKKMIGLNMMNNGMIDPQMLGYFIYRS